MALAHNVAKKSQDPSTRVGCVIVTQNYAAVSFGYNDFVAGCNRRFMTYERPLKHCLEVHAEMNALIAAHTSLHNCRVYVTHAPCPNCLRNLLQAGVTEIVYDNCNTNGKFLDDTSQQAIHLLLKATRINLRSLDGKNHFG
jgi:dCMP deaminase